MAYLIDTHAYLWYALGDSRLSQTALDVIDDSDEDRVLGITTHHAVELSRLAYPRNGHRDPFDRMMIAQCIVEDVPFVSNDADLDEYPIRRIW